MDKNFALCLLQIRVYFPLFLRVELKMIHLINPLEDKRSESLENPVLSLCEKKIE